MLNRSGLFLLLAACLAIATATRLPAHSADTATDTTPKFFETLDGFQVPSPFLNVNGGGSQPMQAANFAQSPTILGGERDLVLSCLGRNNAAYYYEAEVANGTLIAFAQAPNTAVTAEVQLQYDGMDQSANLTQNGLRGIDLNRPGVTGFFLDVRFLNGGAAPAGVFEWWTPNPASAQFVVPSDGSGVFFPFAMLTGSSSNVGAIQITINLDGPTEIEGIFFGLYGSGYPQSASNTPSRTPAPSLPAFSQTPSRSPTPSRSRTPYSSSTRTRTPSSTAMPSSTRTPSRSSSPPPNGIMIDSFSDSYPQQRFLENGTFPLTAVRISQSKNILGGERDLAVSVKTGATGYVVTYQNTNGRFVLNVPAGTQAETTLQYDGKEDSMTLNTTGLAGMNFAQQSAINFAMDLSSSRPVTVKVAVFSGPSQCNWSADGVTTSLKVSFSRFTGNCDWSNVGAVKLVFDCDSGCYLMLDTFRTE